MPLIETKSLEAKGLKGLHLYHFSMSNCSQRVRLTLAEKGLSWTSHHVDLPAGEHLTPVYREIHPKGVVPALVDDGRVVIESNDIIAYLDERHPEPPLVPRNDEDAEAVAKLIAASNAIQDAIKALSHELLFRPFRPVGAEDVEAMKSAGANPELVAFMRDYAANDDTWRVRVARARGDMDVALAALENRLAGRDWLSGPAFGLADISWIVNLHRLRMCQYPLDAYPLLSIWADRVSQRETFRSAVAEYQP